MRRRTFLTALGVGAAATAITGLISSCEKKESDVGGPAVIIRGKTEFEWRMVTTWPPHFPVFGEAAERIAANAPLAVEGTKSAIQAWRMAGIHFQYRMHDWLGKTVLESEDSVEGPLAFSEKRAPAWKGR